MLGVPAAAFLGSIDWNCAVLLELGGLRVGARLGVEVVTQIHFVNKQPRRREVRDVRPVATIAERCARVDRRIDQSE